MNRVLVAARPQVVRPAILIGLRCVVVTVSFAFDWAVWSPADLPNEPDAGFTDGASAVYLTGCRGFVRAVTELLPFAMGISLSRRTYRPGVAQVGTSPRSAPCRRSATASPWPSSTSSAGPPTGGVGL